MLMNQPISKFLDELAGKSSTPGGGSAAAIMGAMGAALVSMVANFTIGKKNYESVDEQMRKLLARSESLRESLQTMVRADVEAFDAVMGAYGMPRDSDEEREARSAAIQSALRHAADVPLQCAELCREVMALCRPMAEGGNRNVISDAGVAVLAAEAALRSAALNVYINIGAIKDAEFVRDRQQRLERILAGSAQETETVYALVKSKL